MNRRVALSLLGAGVAGTGGCLRLQSGGESTPASSTRDGSPTSDGSRPAGTATATATATGESGDEVGLTERWTDENGVDNVWTAEGTF